MSTDPLAFLSQPQTSKKAPQSGDPLSFLKSRSASEKVGRTAAQYGIGAAELGLFPYELAVEPLKHKTSQLPGYRENLFDDIERLSLQKQSGDWDEQDEALLQSLVSQVSNPKESKKFIPRLDIGVGSLAEKASKKLFDYDLAPEGVAEHVARIGGNIVSPKTLAKAAEKAPQFAKGLVDKEFRHAVKEQKNWSRLAKAAEGHPEKETLLKFAQEHKLSPEATSLLFHSEGKAQYLASLGKKTKKFKGVVGELKGKLGQNYEDLKVLGQEGGYLNSEGALKLTDKLTDLLIDMKSPHVIGPETGSAIQILEKAIASVNNEGTTIKRLMDTYQNVGQSIKWGEVNKGNFLKNEIRKHFSDAIKEQNPAIGKRFEDTNRAWAKYEQFKDVLDKKIPIYSWKGIKLPASVAEAAAFLGAAFVPVIGGAASAKAFAIKSILQRLITKMAIDPKYQQPLKLWQKSMITGSTEGQKKAFLMIKKIAKKEDPDLYEDLENIEVD